MIIKNSILIFPSVGLLPYFLMNYYTSEKWEDSDYLDLEVKQSLIPESGAGLFAKSEFEKGDIISEFRGPVLENTQTDDLKYENEDRMLWLNPHYSIIGKNHIYYVIIINLYLVSLI